MAKRPAESRSGTLTCYYARRDGSLATWRQTARAAWEALPAPALPVVIIGGILGGIFTATEAGVTAVVYALIVGFFVYRKLRLKELPRIFAKKYRYRTPLRAYPPGIPRFDCRFFLPAPGFSPVLRLRPYAPIMEQITSDTHPAT